MLIPIKQMQRVTERNASLYSLFLCKTPRVLPCNCFSCTMTKDSLGCFCLHTTPEDSLVCVSRAKLEACPSQSLPGQFALKLPSEGLQLEGPHAWLAKLSIQAKW